MQKNSIGSESRSWLMQVRVGMAVVLASVAVTVLQPNVVFRLNGRWRGIFGKD